MKLGISTVFLNKYLFGKRLGEGAFGTVYLVHRITDPRVQAALKVEPKKSDPADEYLKIECKLMRLLRENKAKHATNLIASGKTDTHSYIVMSLLGPSLHDLRRRMPDSKFSLYTTGVCFLQCLDALQEMHRIGFVHRDVKPMNFAFDRSHASKRYTKSGNIRLRKPRKPRKQTKMIGTLRHCSLNAHHKEELGRQDDLWSL